MSRLLRSRFVDMPANLRLYALELERLALLNNVVLPPLIAASSRSGDVSPRELRPTVQSTCMSSVSAAPTEERLARALAVDIGLANAMRVATTNLPGFDPDSLMVRAGEMTFAPVDSVAKLASDPMPSGGLDRGGLR